MDKDAIVAEENVLHFTEQPDGILITVRVVRSFEYRTVRQFILRNLNATLTVAKLKELIINEIQTDVHFTPWRHFTFDTLKIYRKSQGTKPNNLIINMDKDDEWILNNDKKTVHEVGLENEDEVSFFNRSDYEKYKLHPEVKW